MSQLSKAQTSESWSLITRPLTATESEHTYSRNATVPDPSVVNVCAMAGNEIVNTRTSTSSVGRKCSRKPSLLCRPDYRSSRTLEKAALHHHPQATRIIGVAALPGVLLQEVPKALVSTVAIYEPHGHCRHVKNLE